MEFCTLPESGLDYVTSNGQESKPETKKQLLIEFAFAYCSWEPDSASDWVSQVLQDLLEYSQKYLFLHFQ